MVASERQIPGPRGLPGVGNPWNLRRDPREQLARLAAAFGDHVQFWILGRRFVLLAHPDDIEALLVRHRDATIKDRVTAQLDRVLGQGLLTGEGEHWRTQRRRIAPSFQPRHLASYADAMVRSTVERLPTDGELDVHALMTGVTLDVVVRTLFGAEPGGEADQVGPLLGRLMEAFETEQRSLWRAVPRWVPGPHRVRVQETIVALDALLLGLVRRARAGAPGDSLLSRLLAATDDDGAHMSDQELRDELVTLFLAGHETTSIAVAMTLFLLGEHPEHQDAARAELRSVLGDRPATAEDVRRLPLTEAVLKESMRLFPPAWAMGRELVQDVEIGGHAIPAGTQVVVSQWVTQRDPRFWVGPQWFRPARWTNGEADAAPKHAYFPFGAGPRVCVGQHFAMMEAMLILATFLREREVVSVRGPAPELVPAVTLRPRHGVRVRLRTRRG